MVLLYLCQCWEQLPEYSDCTLVSFAELGARSAEVKRC